MMRWPVEILCCLALLGVPAGAPAEARKGVEQLLTPGRTPPLLVAHRGLSARFPENTLAAFRAAIDAGAEMLELDVGLSRDGVPVVLHDVTLDRTTDGQGPLGRQDLAALRALDAGSWFGPQFEGERLPTLAAALDLCRGAIAVNIEIKPEAVAPAPGDDVAARVVALVRERGMEDQVLVSSFAPVAVARVKKLAPAIRTAVLYHTEIDFDPVAFLGLFRADGLNLSRRHLRAEVVRQLHAAGRFVGVYTVNEPVALRELTALGVDAIFTDDVTAARAALTTR